MKNINWQKLLLELFVVFLGVTGGFILNNFRDTQKDKQLETKYIQSFVQNINSNIEELNSIIADDSLWFSHMKPNLRLLSVDSLPVDSLTGIVQSIIAASNLGLVTSTFEDIKFSGNLNLIRDYQLKENIVKYHHQIEGSLFIDGYYNNYFSEFVMPYVMSNFDMAKQQLFSTDKHQQSLLYNISVGYYSMRLQRLQNIKKLLSESETVKAELENYLNK